MIILSHEPFAEPYSRGLRDYFIPWPQGNFSKKELEEIQKILENYESLYFGQQILANFGGHIHGFEKFGKELRFFGQFSPKHLFFDANYQYPPLSTIPVLTTEALMVGGNEKNLENKGLIRISKIEQKDKIDFSQIEFKEPALNPFFAFDFKILADKVYPCVHFAPDFFTQREFSYTIEYGDGEKQTIPHEMISFYGIIPFDHCYSPLFCSCYL